MSSGPSGASNSHTSDSHDNSPAVPRSLGLMNVARVWSARGPGGLKDIDWYIELESLSETLTCKVFLFENRYGVTAFHLPGEPSDNPSGQCHVGLHGHCVTFEGSGILVCNKGPHVS